MQATHSNFSANSSAAHFAFLSVKIPFIVVYIVLFIIAIIGNLLIVWIVFKDRRLKTTTNYLIVNMAISDLISAAFGFPTLIVHQYFDQRWLIGGVLGNILCKMTAYLINVAFPVSTCSCVGVAIDRYYAVAHPTNKPLRKIKYTIAGIWIVSGIINMGYLYWVVLQEDGELQTCRGDSKIYQTYRRIVDITTAGLPALVVTTMYAIIVYKLYHLRVPGKQLDDKVRRREQQNKKVLKMSVTIVGMLYLSFGFYIIIQTLFSSGKFNYLSTSTKLILYYVSLVMLQMSLVYNFFINVIFNAIYRENVKKMISKCCCILTHTRANNFNSASSRQ